MCVWLSLINDAIVISPLFLPGIWNGEVGLEIHATYGTMSKLIKEINLRQAMHLYVVD